MNRPVATGRRTARIRAGALEGIDGIGVVAEVDISRGLPGFHLVGLPGAEVKESRERVLSAIRNSGLKVPLGKITINLAPAALRKTGAACDLAMALGILAAGRVIDLGPAVRMGATFLGELSLFGEVRAVKGLLSLVMAAAEAGHRFAVVPAEQTQEALLVAGMSVVGVQNLSQAVEWWQGAGALSVANRPRGEPEVDSPSPKLWDDLSGQPLLRKGATIAAAGRHHCLLVGPPGTGKTRLARLLARAAGGLSGQAALEVARIHSAAGLLARGDLRRLAIQRPFRAPHHSLTRAGLIGGGSAPRPGEVTLAHQGVLFLDEISEFAPQVLAGLREPLADAAVTVARSGGARCYPARFQLIAAMNPCRCGYLGSSDRPCRCTPVEIRRHRGRLSGPLLDRFDMFLEVADWQGAYLSREGRRAAGKGPGPDWRLDPTPADLKRARDLLSEWRRTSLRERLSATAARFLDDVRRPMNLSLRGIERCIAVAATVAALDDAAAIEVEHAREALEFRREVLDV